MVAPSEACAIDCQALMADTDSRRLPRLGSFMKAAGVTSRREFLIGAATGAASSAFRPRDPHSFKPHNDV
jgi:hypothetical protein